MLVSKKVTAYYVAKSAVGSRADSGQPTLFQDVAFYPLKRSQLVYQYDSQRRLTHVQGRNPDRLDYTYGWGDVSYEYVGNQLINTNQKVFPLFPTHYDLNSQGYITQYNTYDKDGYLVFRQDGPNAAVTQTIVGGNVVKKIAQDLHSRTTTTYEYDLTKLGLPNPEMVLWGRPSSHLLLKTIDVYESFSDVPSIWPDRTVTTYLYEFDGTGRVKQQTAYVEGSLLPNPAVVSRELQVSVFEFN